MTRPAYHFLVDVFLFLSFLTLLNVEMLVHFVFPAPTRADGWLLWGKTYDQWSRLGFMCLCVFAMTTLVHLILQWGWVCRFVGSRIARKRGERFQITDGTQTLYGVGTFVGVLSVLILLLAIGTITVQSPSGAG